MHQVLSSHHWPLLSPPSSAFKDPFDYTEPTQIIWDNLPIPGLKNHKVHSQSYCSIYTIDDLPTQKNEILIHSVRMSLRNIMLSERSQAPKATYHMIPFRWNIQNRPIYRKISGCLGLGRKWQPTPVFLPGKSHGPRSLAGFSPWGHKWAGHNWATKQG